MEAGFTLSEIDTTKSYPARMYDALLGGKDNYAAGWEAVRLLLLAAPESATRHAPSTITFVPKRRRPQEQAKTATL